MSEIKQNLKKLYKIFKSTEFPFYNKGILKGILPLEGVFYNYNPETIAYIVMFYVPFF